MIQTLPLRVFESKLVFLDPHWQINNRRNSFWRLYFNHSSGASVRSMGTVYPLLPRRLCLLPAGVTFDSDVEPQNGVYPLHFYIHFDIVGFSGLRLREVFNSPHVFPPHPRLEEAALEICNILVPVAPLDPVEIDLALSLKLQTLLLGTVSLAWDSLKPEKQKQSEFLSERYEVIMPAMLYIEENLAWSISNDELASRC